MQIIYAVIEREWEGGNIIYLTTDKAKAEHIKESCEDVEIEEYIDGDVSILDEHIFHIKMETDGTVYSRELDGMEKLFFKGNFDEVKEGRIYSNSLTLSVYIKADTQDDAELKGYNAFTKYLDFYYPKKNL